MELLGSCTFRFMTLCQVICPRRERYQLRNTLAALALGARFNKVITLELPPPRAPPSLRSFGPKAATGSPCFSAFRDHDTSRKARISPGQASRSPDVGWRK